MKSNIKAKNIKLKKSQVQIGGGKATNLFNVILDEKITTLILFIIELLIIYYIS